MRSSRLDLHNDGRVSRKNNWRSEEDEWEGMIVRNPRQLARCHTHCLTTAFVSKASLPQAPVRHKKLHQPRCRETSTMMRQGMKESTISFVRPVISYERQRNYTGGVWCNRSSLWICCQAVSKQGQEAVMMGQSCGRSLRGVFFLRYWALKKVLSRNLL